MAESPMGDGLPTPPDSPSLASSTEASDTLTAIDSLLERYLYLLDEHQKLYQELGKNLSLSFFSLARANQSCPPGRRFGEDYYDERMKAARTLFLSPADSTLTSNSDVPAPSQATYHFAIGNEGCDDQINEELAKGNATSQASDQHDPNNGKSGQQDECTRIINASSNPLRWFGVLVPPALREAQKSFTSAVDGPIFALANVVSEMRVVEQKVHDQRKILSLEGENHEV